MGSKKATLEMEVKRGEKSWAFFPIVYNILLTLSVGIVSVFEICWFYKISVMILVAILLFWLCFFNKWFRNKIVGLMSKSQEKIEKYEV